MSQSNEAGWTALRLDPRDNVVTLLRGIEGGRRPQLADCNAPVARDAIPLGHKMALVDIPAGGAIVKYGQPVGTARSAIAAGSHVHLHNVDGLVGQDLRRAGKREQE